MCTDLLICLFTWKECVPEQYSTDCFQSPKKHVLTKKAKECVQKHMDCTDCQNLVWNVYASQTEAFQSLHNLLALFVHHVK